MKLFRGSRIYLDWAAAAPRSGSAIRAYARAARSFGNPLSPHAEGRAASGILEDARTRIARELSVKADDIIFTSGATEANNLAIRGTVSAWRTAHARRSPHVLYLPSAHASITAVMRALVREGLADAEPLVVREGRVDVDALKRQLKPETALVSMEFVCGETGTIWNVREVLHVLESNERPTRSFTDARAMLHVDASQAPPTQSIERSRIAGDLIVLDGLKLGVRGIGALAFPRTLAITPMLYGGGQERGMRPGTPDPARAAAFAAALAGASSRREKFARQAQKMRTHLLEHISACIPDVAENSGAVGIPSILNLSFVQRDTDYLVALLDEAGFAVATRSACETESTEGSRAVFVLTGDRERARATLRISWGPSTSARDLARFAAALERAVRFLDSSASK